MPIYEYECPGCGERFEQYCPVADSDNEVKCPKCGAEPRRVFSPFNVGGSGACLPRVPT